MFQLHRFRTVQIKNTQGCPHEKEINCLISLLQFFDTYITEGKTVSMILQTDITWFFACMKH